MKIKRLNACVALIALTVLALAPVAARADLLWDISVGTAAPPPTLGGYTMTPSPADPSPEGTPTAALPTPIGGFLTFTPPTFHEQVGSGWATWSHGYTGDVYATGGPSRLSLGMPAGTGAFYFYAEPNPFQTFRICAYAFDGTVEGACQMVDGDSGAKPSSLALLALGTLTLAARQRKRKM